MSLTFNFAAIYQLTAVILVNPDGPIAAAPFYE
jgi:hypothetical protein